MAASILFALIAAQPAPIPESPVQNVRVLRHGPRPCCGSGIFHFTVTYEVEDTGGARYLMYQTYAGENDSLSPAGSRCTIWFEPRDGRTIVHDRHGDETNEPHLLITRMACDARFE
jgi:hypothetical protein